MKKNDKERIDRADRKIPGRRNYLLFGKIFRRLVDFSGE
jgi:hypothetical protein|nr:MAG TPA: hypothetical protein [Caudoviricetes sp.]